MILYNALKKACIYYSLQNALMINESVLTYSQLIAKVDHLASLLLKKASIGTRIGILLSNPLDVIISVFAINKIGSSAVLLEKDMSASEILYCSGILSFSLIVSKINEKFTTNTLNNGQIISNNSNNATHSNLTDAIVYFTSGSNGKPGE